MSLNYRRDRNDRNVTELSRSVHNDVKLPLFLHSLESHKAQVVEAAYPCLSMDGRPYTLLSFQPFGPSCI